MMDANVKKIFKCFVRVSKRRISKVLATSPLITSVLTFGKPHSVRLRPALEKCLAAAFTNVTDHVELQEGIVPIFISAGVHGKSTFVSGFLSTSDEEGKGKIYVFALDPVTGVLTVQTVVQ